MVFVIREHDKCRYAVHPVLHSERLARLLITERDCCPRHLLRVGLELGFGLIGGDKDELEVLALGRQRIVRLLQHRGKHFARRAPMSTEVNTNILATKVILQVELLARSAATKQHVAGDFGEWLRSPRVVAWCVDNTVAGLRCDSRAGLGVNSDDSGNSLNFVLLAEFVLKVSF